MDADQAWQRLLHGIRDGDEEACRDFWERYSPRIERLAEGNIASGLRRRVGPESIVLSACRTFFRRAKQGEFEIPDADSLWQLMCAITLNKIRMKHRDHHRQKRALDQEVHLDAAAGGAAQAGILAAKPSPDEVVEFDDHLQHIVNQLDEDDQRVLEFKLQELTNEEIAEKLRCSEKTVRRRVTRIRSRLAYMLD